MATRSHGSKRAASIIQSVKFFVEPTESVNCLTLTPYYRAGWEDTAGNRFAMGLFNSEEDAITCISGARFFADMIALDVAYGGAVKSHIPNA